MTESDCLKLLLQEARFVAQAALDRLQALHERYPADVPGEAIEVLRQINAKHHSEQPDDVRSVL